MQSNVMSRICFKQPAVKKRKIKILTVSHSKPKSKHNTNPNADCNPIPNPKSTHYYSPHPKPNEIMQIMQWSSYCRQRKQNVMHRVTLLCTNQQIYVTLRTVSSIIL